ncbi:MAG: hypothetical protein WCE79_06390 [Xanthobacteraceae bacterium]
METALRILTTLRDTAVTSSVWAIENPVAAVGIVIPLVALLVAWLQLRRTPLPPSAVPELRLWDHGDRYVEGYLTLHNHGATTATIDQIKIIRPRRSKIGWPDIDPPFYGRRFKEPINHDVLLHVEPRKSAGVGMLIELPAKHYPPKRVAVRVRLSTQDRRRAMMINCVATRIDRAIKLPPISGVSVEPKASTTAPRSEKPRQRYNPLAERQRYNPFSRRRGR